MVTILHSTYAILTQFMITVKHTYNSTTEEGQKEKWKWRMPGNEHTKVGG
jgi:hypothetical protein